MALHYKSNEKVKFGTAPLKGSSKKGAKERDARLGMAPIEEIFRRNRRVSKKK